MFNSSNLTDAFFSPESGDKPEITEVALKKLVPYENQPFNLYSEDKLRELAEDIKENGLLNPIIIRPHGKGKYQIIAGHNRVQAFIMNGETMISAIVKGMSDQEAAIALVNSNLNQRQELSQGEKAKAYKLRHEAVKAQGKRGAGNALDKLSESSKDSGRTIARYIRANDLITSLFDRFSEGKLSLSVAERLASLDPAKQQVVDDYLEVSNRKLTDKMVNTIINQDNLSVESLVELFSKPAKPAKAPLEQEILYEDFTKSHPEMSQQDFSLVIRYLQSKGLLR